ncbi:inositol monophosphatase 1-like [Watersipora subatra]|uniref:inositol monophosphatase 1-like n=1 Tax=Watersipora subatra TaxID=2589382 RepID=UPI00355C9D06
MCEVIMESSIAHEIFSHACELIISVGDYVRGAAKSKICTESKECFADLVTEHDQNAEKMLVTNLTSKYPDHRFIAEEMNSDGVSCQFLDDPTWIIDPIDGTTNFVHGFPSYSISVGFYVKKEPVFGIVYDIDNDKMYSAIKGEGAFCNGRVIKCSTTADLKNALIGSEFGSQRDEVFLQFKIDSMSRVVRKCHGIRSTGSAALQICGVAAGYLDAYYEAGPHIWDFAAAQLIALEAGAVVSSLNGGPFDIRSRKILVACNSTIAGQLSPLIGDFELTYD